MEEFTIEVGEYSASASSNQSTFTIGDRVWTMIAENYVKGINIADTVTVSEGEITSKILGDATAFFEVFEDR